VILFAAFLRRPARREDVAVSRSAAAVLTMPGPTAPAPSGPATSAQRTGADGETFDPNETNLARWLRPALRQQRESGGRGMLPVAHEPVRFDAPAAAGVERRRISYRLVRVSDAPDDIRSSEIGRLDRGDEVEVIGESGGYLQVRTASGLVGWVPRMVIVG
jgi:hypothetical protein